MPPDDHDCGWKDYAEQLQGELARLKAELAQLKRQVYGRKSEKKMPPVEAELRGDRPSRRNGPEAQSKRREHAEQKKHLETVRVDHELDADTRCPHCGTDGPDFEPIGHKISSEYEYVQGYFRRKMHHRVSARCPCGQYIVTARAPERIGERTSYAPSFVAHLITAKCADSLPFYRLEKHYRRSGVPIARSTMVNLFHRAGALLGPLAERVLAIIAASDVVLADETPIRVQQRKKKAFLWTFLAGDLIAYRYSPSRSGQTPLQVLGGSKGTLVVDGYTGYNQVTKVDGRTRAGCLAHARRRFFNALETAPEAQTALDAILDLYRVEQDARARGIEGTDEHLRLRQERSRAIMDGLGTWIARQSNLHPPKSPLGEALAYARNNWTELTHFLDDVRVPLDNNASERALRVVALGRKNFLSVGHDEAGQNTATLYTLTACCDAAGVNPLDYFADVLLRVQSHPASEIDDLLPNRWAPAEP